MGLPIIGLEITSSTSELLPKEERKIITLFSRQHPYESPTSFVVEGLLEFLISEDLMAVLLRNLFIFLIFPMVNPDGVVVGNSRTNICGRDLNNNWDSPRSDLDSEIFGIKQYLKEIRPG